MTTQNTTAPATNSPFQTFDQFGPFKRKADKLIVFGYDVPRLGAIYAKYGELILGVARKGDCHGHYVVRLGCPNNSGIFDAFVKVEGGTPNLRVTEVERVTIADFSNLKTGTRE